MKNHNSTPSRPHRPRDTRTRGPSTPLIVTALILGSIGYGLTLTPSGGVGVPILVVAAVLLLVGLHMSTREELMREH